MILELLALYQLAKQPEINYDFTSLNNKQIEIIKQDSIERKLYDYSIKNDLIKDLSYSTFRDSLYEITAMKRLKRLYEIGKESQRKCNEERIPRMNEILMGDSVELAIINPNFREDIKKAEKLHKELLEKEINLKNFFENAYNNNEKVYMIDTTLFRIKSNNINYLKIEPYESRFIYKIEHNIPRPWR